MTLRRAEIDQFRDAIARRFGFRVDDNRMDELGGILRRRMAEGRTVSVGQYLPMFEASLGEQRAVASEVTVCETYFFRIPEHYQALTEVVLPNRVKAQSSRRQLAILSAGCSSGEEAYSIAITVGEQASMLKSWCVAIGGVDINPVTIARARQACYPEWSLRDTPENVRELYFRRTGKQFHLAEAIREMVCFEEGNLVDPNASFWQRDTYDVIFLRNVLMYFAPDAAEAVVACVAECLLPGGYLFLGPAETLRGLSTEFHLCHTNDAFLYQRRERLETRSGPPQVPRAVPGPPAKTLAGSGNRPVVLPELNASWIDNIRRASERIQNLTQSPPELQAKPPGDLPAAANVIDMLPGCDVKLALELLRQERFADALAVVQKLPSESQADPDVQLLCAVLLANGGDLARAEKTCRLLLASNDLNAGAHYLIALCREHVGDPDAAVEHDRIAVYLDSAFAMPHLHLGLLAKRSGQSDMACQELRQAAVLLALEDASRVLLFGGGFAREALIDLCHREIGACGGKP